jgi:hypothetical protein
MSQHTLTYYIERAIADGQEETSYQEIELELSYTYHPAVPEQGPTYDCGGQPAEPALIEDVCATHDGEPFELTPKEEADAIDYIGATHDDSYDP